MVDLVLRDTREHPGGVEHLRRERAVEKAQPHAIRADDRLADIGDGQAAFLVSVRLGVRQRLGARVE